MARGRKPLNGRAMTRAERSKRQRDLDAKRLDDLRQLVARYEAKFGPFEASEDDGGREG